MSDPTPPPLPPPPPAAPAVGRQTSVLAIVSLVFGLLGWTLLPLVGSLVAVITGHLARAEVRRTAGAVDGDGLAIAGLVLGYSMMALAIIGVLAAVLFFGGLVALLAVASAVG
ncbi:DUF4190 domain-containing protein [Novilysobacter luteus]|uniref:DUF4190 domain-containing protein n=1 Tax=Novilysobacter luteus TaxID=2822368 RepID=A0ABM8UEC3_9GAMM|nr:DUF4190 domain-containing protein [Lysobacter luteus]CAG4971632.1 hypothetical protein LYB30171_01018 [Lysobacter luteus]